MAENNKLLKKRKKQEEKKEKGKATWKRLGKRNQEFRDIKSFKKRKKKKKKKKRQYVEDMSKITFCRDKFIVNYI